MPLPLKNSARVLTFIFYCDYPNHGLNIYFFMSRAKTDNAHSFSLLVYRLMILKVNADACKTRVLIPLF